MFLFLGYKFDDNDNEEDKEERYDYVEAQSFYSTRFIFLGHIQQCFAAFIFLFSYPDPV